MIVNKLALALMLSGVSAGALAGDWFHHPFGELRAYHGDWLNVCQLHGLGECRTVQLPIEDPRDSFFSDRRLSVNIAEDGSVKIDIFSQNMPDQVIQPIIIIDQKVFGLKPQDWAVGDYQYPNVAQTITITNPAINAALLAAMKAGNRFTITFGREDTLRVEAIFMLRGFTAATRAIETQINTRRDNS